MSEYEGRKSMLVHVPGCTKALSSMGMRLLY